MKKEITYEELQAAASYVQARLPYTPKVALVLGSGLGDFADRLTLMRRSNMVRSHISRYRQWQGMLDVSCLEKSGIARC